MEGTTVAPELIEIADALDSLGEALENVSGANNSPLNQNWQFAPPLDRYELAAPAYALAGRIRLNGIGQLTEDEQGQVHDLAARVTALKDSFVPHLYNGNAVSAANPILTTLYAIDGALQPFMGWDKDPALAKLPNRLARRLRGVANSIEALESESGTVKSKVDAITAAYDAADRLDTTLEELREANERVVKLEREATNTAAVIKAAHEESAAFRRQLEEMANEAKGLIEQCEEAYRTTTSKGLAGAFEDRAQKLNTSMKWWVLGLGCALALGTVLGAIRVSALSTVLASDNPNWGSVALHMVLSIVSVGAPLWFAWMATKQIGQQFRLAEDYAFKASVAKAYEGYRREAAKIDEEFSARLFASALSRLEEAPLRVMDGAQVEGSPWHELIKSANFSEKLTAPQIFATNCSAR